MRHDRYFRIKHVNVSGCLKAVHEGSLVILELFARE
jgi:hypothetical protein